MPEDLDVVEQYEDCPDCDGTGYDEEDEDGEEQTCGYCNGEGEVLL
jgi:DnaJ-class molecular chaperone